ncbi:unnamed protein product [Chrysoparadoxa australica]
MSTGQQRMLGTSSGRMRTGQVPSTPSREAAMGIALSADLKVSERPVTQQGMMGMKTSSGGGHGRLVQDGTFYIGILQQKVAEIQKEIGSLQEEIEQYDKDSNQIGKRERAYESLLAEVKGLEGTLADYNLAMDKTRTTADPGEVSQYLSEVEEHNKREARELDQVFLSKQQKERHTQQVEEEIAHLHRSLEDKINSLEPNKLDEYRRLLNQNQHLQEDMAAKQSELDRVMAAVRDCEHFLGSGNMREEYKAWEKKVGRLRKEKDALAKDMEIADMDSKQARDVLLARVKMDQERSKQIDRDMAELEDDMTKMRQHISELDSDLKGQKHGEIDQSKIEVLQKRDHEMTEYIDKFDGAKAQATQDMSRVQGTIVALLEHISSGLEAQHNIPDKDKMAEIKDESTFKEKQLKSSETTMKRLQTERNKRQQELEKVNSLDAKIPMELETLNDKIAQMKEGLAQFEDIEGLREEAARTKEYLSDLKQQYTIRRDGMKVQVQQCTAAYEAKKKQAASETAKSMESLEQKLRTYETNIFSLREYIETKGREIDYKSLRQDCANMVTSLNEFVKEYGTASTAY